MNVMNHVKMAMLANGRGSGTSAEQAVAAEKAQVVSIVNGEKINQAAVEMGVKLIIQSVKESAGWTRSLFVLIRSCKDRSEAKGSLITAEDRAVIKLRELIAQEDPGYTGKIKNLSDVVKYNGGTLSYVTTKSKLFGVLDNVDDLCSDLQGLWLDQAKHDGAPHKALADGYLDAWSKRYADVKGSTLFMRDAREAQAAGPILKNREEQRAKAAAKQASAETGQNGKQTQQQIVSGTNVDQKGLQVKSTQEALNKVIVLTHDVDNDEGVSIEDTNAVLTECASKLQALLVAARDVTRAEVSQAGGTAHTGVPAVSAQVPDAAVDGSSDVARPEWIAEDQWAVMSSEEQDNAIEAGRDIWTEEAKLMEQANEQEDAGSNEPIAAQSANG